jgi:hypothetical protein
MEFEDVVTNPARFRELMGEPPCVDKTIAIADRHRRPFLARSPFVLIASANALGQMDISPKETLQVSFGCWMTRPWRSRTGQGSVGPTRSRTS